MKTLSLSLSLSLSYNYYSLVLICERFMVFRVYLFQGILIVLNRFLIFWKKKYEYQSAHHSSGNESSFES